MIDRVIAATDIGMVVESGPAAVVTIACFQTWKNGGMVAQ